MIKPIISLLLVTVASAQYASFASWDSTGCNETASNYIYQLFIYPADGSCFSPTGGEFTIGYGYQLTVNATHVTANSFYYEDCTSPSYIYYFPLDTCISYFVVSAYENLPDDSYWQSTQTDSQPWDALLITDYYSAAGCDDDYWIDSQVQGGQECNEGYHYYCSDGELNLDLCTDAECNSGCQAVTEPLSNACTLSADVPAFWQNIADVSSQTSVSYQATCVGGNASTVTLSAAVIISALALVF